MKVMSYETMANCTNNCLSWVKGDTSVSSPSPRFGLGTRYFSSLSVY
jgi:hypothetical protein